MGDGTTTCPLNPHRVVMDSGPLHLGIVHYHLNRGGVTQVIVNHLRSLLAADGPRPERVGIFFGGRREGFADGLLEQLRGLAVELHPLPELDYDDDQDGPRPAVLGQRLRDALQHAGFGPERTVLHVHNHNLGKNLSLPGALAALAREGFGLLLQIHDFAEDFRPDNYRHLARGLAATSPAELAACLYPQTPRIHYATLNARDARILAAAGVESERLHGLPNPVAALPELPPADVARAKLERELGIPPDRAYLLYPVRGIRRKNIGEAVFWSALAGPGVTVGLTLPPTSAVDLPGYAAWRQTARQLQLPFAFEVGAAGNLSFGENLAASQGVLTTSVAEGFGMVFLEPWLIGLPLAGRDLPEVTADYRAAGLDLDALYERLDIPLEEIDRARLESDWREAFLEILRAFAVPLPSERALRDAIESRLASGRVDFASLSRVMQTQLVERAARDARLRDRVLRLNPKLSQTLETFAARPADEPGGGSRESLVARNAEAVNRAYSLPASGNRLCAIYASVASSPHSETLAPAPHGERILDAFLDLHRFHPVRTEQ